MCVCVCVCVCVCKVGGIKSLRLRNDVAGPWSVDLKPSPHSLGNTQALIDTSVPFLPRSDWVGSRAGQAARESAHSPAPALCPNNAASPSPCLYPAGYLAAAARDLPLPSLPSLLSRPAGSSNRPFARQLEGWGGGEVWARAWAWRGGGWGVRQGLGFGMQGFRPENLNPRHTRSGWGHTCPPGVGGGQTPQLSRRGLGGSGRTAGAGQPRWHWVGAEGSPSTLHRGPRGSRRPGRPEARGGGGVAVRRCAGGPAPPTPLQPLFLNFQVVRGRGGGGVPAARAGFILSHSEAPRSPSLISPLAYLGLRPHPAPNVSRSPWLRRHWGRGVGLGGLSGDGGGGQRPG